jgi:HTH-type transcriptional regulator / antitoxin HipB
MYSGRDESHLSRRFYRARTADALGAALQGARRAQGLTQDDLAAVIGSSRPTLSRLERGGPVATDTLVEALAACGYELVVVPRGTSVTVDL